MGERKDVVNICSPVCPRRCDKCIFYALWRDYMLARRGITKGLRVCVSVGRRSYLLSMRSSTCRRHRRESLVTCRLRGFNFVSCNVALACCSIAAMFAAPVAFRAPLRVLTWNTLAPCYFRQGGRVEASEPSTFLARHEHIVRVIADVGADIVCLQEFWFDDVLMRLYQNTLESQYDILTLQRSGSNWEGRSEDGVAILLRRESVVLERRRDVLFQNHGIPQDRVALLAIVRVVRPSSGGEEGHCTSSDVVDTVNAGLGILCTHLTFPHSPYDERSRAHQIGACLAAINAEPELRASDDGPMGLPVILCGDLNGPCTDRVGQALRGAGFFSAWEHIHGPEGPITHVDHRGQQMTSDHLYLRGSKLEPRVAELLPTAVPGCAELPRPVIGRLRSNRASDPRCEDAGVEWSDLSDHRAFSILLEWMR